MANLLDVITELNNNTASMIAKFNTTLNNLPTIVQKEVANSLPTQKVGAADNANTLGGKSLAAIKTDILHEGDISEFLLVENSKLLRYSTDDIDPDLISQGYELFCPHSEEEYEIARKYLVKLNKPKMMGPLGIYYPSNSPTYPHYQSLGWCSGMPLNSGHMGKKGWKVKDGSRKWWASNRTNVTEPNGDYKANAYLGITYDAVGRVQWYNDAYDRYAYKNYLCVKRIKKY